MSFKFVELYLKSSVGLESVKSIDDYKNICYSYNDKIYIRHDNLKKSPKEITITELKFKIVPYKLSTYEFNKINSHRIELNNHYSNDEIRKISLSYDVSKLKDDEIYDLQLLKAIILSSENKPTKKIIKIDKKYFGYDTSNKKFKEIDSVTNFNQFKTNLINNLLKTHTLDELSKLI